MTADLPRRTLAAILIEQHQALVVDEIELPSSLDVGQVLIEVFYSGICGSQLGEIDGVKGPDPWLPHLLGHEGSGRVLAIGAGVRHVKPGQHVVAHWRPAKGIESATPKYTWKGKTVNAGWITTFNRYAVVAENRLTHIPDNTDMRAAALYGCAVTTGFGVIDHRAQLRLGHQVVVFGAGGVGLNIIQAAHLAGARAVVAVDLYDNRLELAKKCGATHIVNANISDTWTQLAAIFAGQAPDIFIDNTGNPDIIARGYELVGPSGQVILVGVPKKGAKTAIYTLPLHFGKHICGTQGGECMPHTDIPRYMALTDARKVNLLDLITDEMPLSGVNTLIERMRNGTTAGRVLIDLRASQS